MRDLPFDLFGPSISEGARRQAHGQRRAVQGRRVAHRGAPARRDRAGGRLAETRDGSALPGADPSRAACPVIPAAGPGQIGPAVLAARRFGMPLPSIAAARHAAEPSADRPYPSG